MKKKFFVSAILIAIISLFTISYTFAAENNNNAGSDAVNGIRNFVGGAENVVEDAGKDAADGIRSGINAIGNGANSMGNDVENGMNRNGNENSSEVNQGMTGNMGQTDGMAGSDNGGYTATRTSAEGGNNMFANVSSNVWTWLIIAIVGIIIVALVMYYAKQNTNTTNYYNDDDDNNQ